jgi:hypothetical protein
MCSAFCVGFLIAGRGKRDTAPKHAHEQPQAAKAEQVDGLGLSEQDVVDSYIYIPVRYLVIRQEHIDIAEEGVNYNLIKDGNVLVENNLILMKAIGRNAKAAIDSEDT